MLKNNPSQLKSFPFDQGGSALLAAYKKSFSARIVVQFLFTCLVSYFVLIWLTDWPTFSIFIVDLLVCLYLCSIFTHKLRYIFLLHPFIMWISGQFFSVPFLELGDGPAYKFVIDNYINDPDVLVSTFEYMGMIETFKYISLGIAPVFGIPEYLYGAPESNVYFLWQCCFHIILVAACVTLARVWQVVWDEYLLAIALFAVVSPSFFEFVVAPTRHVVTFASVFLFYISFIAISQKISIDRLVGLVVAITLVVISKFTLLIPLLIFCTYYLLFEGAGESISRSKKILIALLIFGALAFGYENFSSKISEYGDNSLSGANTFSGLVAIPVLGMFFKYLYALLAPFPWHEAPVFIDTTYGGNQLMFVMHMLSSLTGVYFFARLLIYGKPLLKQYYDLRPMVMFALIMSLSILMGSTGFHMYLIIYFPFLAPLFLIKNYRLSYYFPLVFVIVVEGVYAVAKL